MVDIEFWKMSGSGNDFIVIDNRDEKVGEDEMPRLVERVCRRRASVGADGVIFVVKSERYDFGWRFFNADGGEAEMCGNGSRCVSRFALMNGIAGPRMTFETLAGPISAEVDGRRVKVLMPRPFGLKMGVYLNGFEGVESMDFLNTGVPHVVARVKDLPNHPVFDQGKVIRHHHQFAPWGTNVNFIRVTCDNGLEVRTYERGVEDETLACGTGAIASALTASVRGLVQSPVRVKTQGGEELLIHFKKAESETEPFSEVWLEGNTAIVYQARLHEEAL